MTSSQSEIKPYYRVLWTDQLRDAWLKNDSSESTSRHPGFPAEWIELSKARVVDRDRYPIRTMHMGKMTLFHAYALDRFISYVKNGSLDGLRDTERYSELPGVCAYSSPIEACKYAHHNLDPKLRIAVFDGEFLSELHERESAIVRVVKRHYYWPLAEFKTRMSLDDNCNIVEQK